MPRAARQTYSGGPQPGIEPTPATPPPPPPRRLTIAPAAIGGTWGDPCSLGTHYAPELIVLGKNMTLSASADHYVTSCERCGVSLRFRRCGDCDRLVRATDPHTLEACRTPSPVVSRGGKPTLQRRVRAGT